MHESNAARATCLGDIQRAEDVRLEIVTRIAVGIRNRDEGGQVKDEVAALDRLRYRLDVANIAEDDVDFGERCLRDKIQQPLVAARVVADESSDFRSLQEKRFDKMAADEAAGTCDESLAARERAHWEA